MKWVKRVIILVIIALGIDVGRYAIIPDVSLLATQNPIPTAFMQYRMEEWAKEGIDKHLDQQWVNLGQISPAMIKAVLIAEDDKFWHHDGFDVEGLEDAMVTNLQKGKFAAGGSTVSQQLIKNIYLSPSKNPIRKIKEAILTYRMEKALSKRRILELYLNIAEWGDGIFGIEAASLHYYHKSAKNLTPQEAAHLAVILPNPLIFDPLGKQPYVTRRAAVVYKIMLRRGVVLSAYRQVMTAPAPIPALDVNATPPTQESLPTLEESNTSETVEETKQ